MRRFTIFLLGSVTVPKQHKIFFGLGFLGLLFWVVVKKYQEYSRHPWTHYEKYYSTVITTVSQTAIEILVLSLRFPLCTSASLLLVEGLLGIGIIRCGDAGGQPLII